MGMSDADLNVQLHRFAPHMVFMLREGPQITDNTVGEDRKQETEDGSNFFIRNEGTLTKKNVQ